MSNREPIIKIENLGVRYDKITALEHVNLTIYSDDFIGVIGPNGGGKSTLVKAIMGVVPYSGDILFGESLMRHKKPHIILLFEFRSNYNSANAFRMERPTAPLFSGWN